MSTFADALAAIDAAIVNECQYRTLPQGKVNDQAQRNVSSRQGTPLLLGLIEARAQLLTQNRSAREAAIITACDAQIDALWSFIKPQGSYSLGAVGDARSVRDDILKEQP